jgi:hypothetical protein
VNEMRIHHGGTEARRKITSLDRAQLLTYLKLTGKKLGFILNFNCPVVTRDGLVRLVL